MVCIYCSGETQVINSRLQKRSNNVWRRRKCLDCQGLFTTIEGTDYSTSLLFRSSEKHAEAFQRDILFVSIYEACKHRKKAVEAATALTDTVLGRLRAKINGATVERAVLISVTADVLKRYDKAAYTAYLAYHKL